MPIRRVLRAINQMEIQHKLLCWIMIGFCIVCFIFATYRFSEGKFDKAIILTVSLFATLTMLKLMLSGRHALGRWLYVLYLSLFMCLIAARYPAEHAYWIFPGILSIAFALRGLIEAFLVLGILIVSMALLLSQGEMSHVLVIFTGSHITQSALATLIVFLTQQFASETKQALSEDINRSEIDPLTSTFNRRAFDQALRSAFESSTYCVLILIDIDHFKVINDKYGHAAGDLALKHVASFIKSALRENEFLARYGGEEFAVIVKNAHFVNARLIAERIRLEIESHAIELDDGRIINCTASIGIADNKTDSIEGWFREADANLYKAKQGGRNQVKAIYSL